MFYTIHQFLSRYAATLALGLSLLLFWLSPRIVRQLDFTAAPIDLGILTALPLTALTVLAFTGLTGLIIRSQWPVLTDYQQQFFEHTFKSLLSWQKVVIYIGLFLSLFYAFIVVLSVVC